jgi:hypothetical protein
VDFDINALGKFQFDNLILQRVPFRLILLGTKLEMQLPNSVSINEIDSIDIEAAYKYITHLGLPKGANGVVICEDGVASKSLVRKLNSEGFNFYFLQSGLSAITQPDD